MTCSYNINVNMNLNLEKSFDSLLIFFFLTDTRASREITLLPVSGAPALPVFLPPWWTLMSAPVF